MDTVKAILLHVYLGSIEAALDAAATLIHLAMQVQLQKASLLRCLKDFIDREEQLKPMRHIEVCIPTCRCFWEICILTYFGILWG